MVTLKPDFLRGSYPPLITPFIAGKVDFKKFRELTKRQLSSGSHGILVTGTTGEPSSLTIDERSELLEVALEAVGGRIPVVAATGSQSLAETVELTTRAEKAGASAALVVTPYYIKPSQRGLIEYFRAVGDTIQLPLMMYHIPGRAAVSVKLQTLVAISQVLPHFVGIKHATADLELVTEIRASLGPEFRIFSGVEALSLPMLLVGASGLMNAVGNLAPDRVAALYNAVQRGDLKTGQELHFSLFELNQSIFLDTNPIPLKYMMSRVGLLETPELRLPLVPIDGQNAHTLDGVLRRAGLLQSSA